MWVLVRVCTPANVLVCVCVRAQHWCACVRENEDRHMPGGRGRTERDWASADECGIHGRKRQRPRVYFTHDGEPSEIKLPSGYSETRHFAPHQIYKLDARITNDFVRLVQDVCVPTICSVKVNARTTNNGKMVKY